MGLINFLKGQFIDVIEWIDDSRDTLAIRFAEASQHEIKNGAQLTVRESQVAQFISEGEYGDTFGPGRHLLTTQNIPILTSLKSWKYGFESPFKADVYFITTRLFTGNRWGTANPIMMRDTDFGIVRTRAYGTYDFRVVEPKLFLKEVVGTDEVFRLEEFGDTMRSRIVSIFSEAVAKAKVPVLDLATQYQELGAALLPLINPFVQSKYGLEITAFIVENVSVPPEVEQAIDKRSSMGAVGNLNDYVKFQLAQGLQFGTGGGVAGAAMEAAIGIGIARDLGQISPQTPPPLPMAAVSAGAVPPPLAPTAPAPPAAPTSPAGGAALPDLMSPSQAAELLGVTEADVLASLEAGDLKGKKIGATYRITRKAIDEFLNS
jgi:excisionase family DNA binding protein